MKLLGIKQFEMKQFQWGYGLFLLPVVLWLPSSAQALTCKVDSFVSPNLGVITLNNANTASVEQTLTYSCINNSNVTEWASVCISADGGDRSPSQVHPRYLFEPSGSKLNFNLILKDKNNATWGSRSTEGTEFVDFFSVPPSDIATVRKTIIKASLLSNNATAIAGNYTASFTGVDTALMFATVNSSSDNQQCLTVPQGTSQFSFNVQANVVAECKIIAKPTDINLKSVPASKVDISGNSSIGVTCTNTAPYTIGLAPSNGNKNGSGVMKGTNGKPTVPYQLRSEPGLNGKEWGNTATSIAVGNGVKGTGIGSPLQHTVYITIPSADFKPDNYSDIVTIRVNY